VVKERIAEFATHIKEVWEQVQRSHSSVLVEQVEDIPNLAQAIATQINSAYIQQFMANTISALLSYRDIKDAVNIPTLMSAFPRRAVDHVLTECDIEYEIREIAETTDLPR